MSGVVNVWGGERLGWWMSGVVNVWGGERLRWWTSGVVNVWVMNVLQSKQARFQKQMSRGNRLVEGVQLVQLPSLGNLTRLRKWRGAKKELQKHWSLHWKSAIYNYRGLLIIMEKRFRNFWMDRSRLRQIHQRCIEGRSLEKYWNWSTTHNHGSVQIDQIKSSVLLTMIDLAAADGNITTDDEVC